MTTWEPGQAVEWLWEGRMGYCPSWWVPARVVRVGPKRVTIDALRTNGTTRRRVVTPDRLRVARPGAAAMLAG